MKRKILFLSLLLGYQGLIFFLSSQPVPTKLQIDKFDKLLHLVEYFPLGILWLLFLNQFEIRRSYALSFVFSSFYALSDEFHQMFVPGRIASWQDLGVDLIGIALGLYSLRKWQR